MQNIPVRVVVRYLDGTLYKGTTNDFFPNKSKFHVIDPDTAAETEVFCSEIKAVFFVKDLQGDRSREDLPGFVTEPGETLVGRKIAIRFKDGELLCGYSMQYSPAKAGFVVFPADTACNNLRVYVLTHSTREIHVGPNADPFVTRVLSEMRAGRSAPATS